ncbi:MAG: AMIN domain-containing protein [Polyangiales bacterium]
MRSITTPRRSLSLLVGCGLLSLSALAFAQEAPPPMTVPTEPITQTWTAPPPGDTTTTAKPAPTPKPAPKGGSGAGGGSSGGGGAAPAPAGSSSAAVSSPEFNNEGVFKISGTKGSGWVGGPKAPKPKAGAAPAPAKGGGGGKSSAHAAAVGKSAPVAEWPGFQMTSDGGSEVMVEFSKPATSPSEHPSAGTYEYVFPGTSVKKGNSKNPLLTSFFNTPVSRASLKQVGADVHLVIELRSGASATPTTSTRASADAGGQQFVVKFPSGSWLPAGGVVDAKPASKGDSKSTGGAKGGGKHHGHGKAKAADQ